MDMEQLKAILRSGSCRGVARSAQGEIRRFERRGVADLFALVTDEPGFLCGASVADKVIGRGAALLLLKGGAREVYAEVISSGALGVLRSGRRGSVVRRASGQHHQPHGRSARLFEKLTAGTSSPDEAYGLIKEFLKGKDL